MSQRKITRGTSPTRRRLLIATARTSALAALLTPLPALADAAPLAPTPACDDGDAPTRRSTAGPFYSPDSPRRAALRETASQAQPVFLRGRVTDTRCRPLRGAQVELWHADERGRYDNDGFRYRGHLLTDEHGQFQFDTIKPGNYPGRTVHFHVRVQPAGGRVLTTQLYFPDQASRNARDGLFHESLLLTTRPHEDALLASFGFVIDTARS